MRTCECCGAALPPRELTPEEQQLKKTAEALSRGGPWDALATTLGEDKADTIRKFLSSLPATVRREDVEHALLGALLRKEHHGKVGPMEWRDVTQAIDSVEKAYTLLRRGYPYVALGTGFERAIATAREHASVLRRKQGRPAWRKDLITALQGLGVDVATAATLADAIGLAGTDLSEPAN